MPKSTIFPYRPSPGFTGRLRSCGFTWGQTQGQPPSRNAEAKKLLGGIAPRRNRNIATVIAVALVALAVAWPVFARNWERDPGTPSSVTRIQAWHKDFQSFEQIPNHIALGAISSFLVASLALLVAIRLKSRKRKEWREKKTKYMENNMVTGLSLIIGGATRTGLIRSENQDAFDVMVPRGHNGGLVVCDGVGGHPGGRGASQFASRHLTAFLKRRDLQKASSLQICARALAATQKAFARDRIPGLTTAIVATLKDGWLHYAVLGDGALTVIHGDGMVQQLLVPHHARDAASNIITAYLSANQSFIPRMGAIRLDPGAMVLAMSDGASDHLPVEWIADGRARFVELIRSRGADWLANNLLGKLEAARDETTGEPLHSDNMTLVIAALVPAGDPE